MSSYPCKQMVLFFLCVIFFSHGNTRSQDNSEKDENTGRNLAVSKLIDPEMRLLLKNKVTIQHVLFLPNNGKQDNATLMLNIFNQNYHAVSFEILVVNVKGSSKTIVKGSLQASQGREFNLTKYLEYREFKYGIVRYPKAAVETKKRNRKTVPLQVQSFFTISDCQSITDRIPGILMVSP